MLVVAHRGASGEFPENTLLAFEQAILQGADGIELDVQQHPDGRLLLLHDRFTVNNSGVKVHFSELAAEQTTLEPEKASPSIPTLEQALACISGRCFVNVEIKSADDSEEDMSNLLYNLKRAIDNAIAKHGFSERQFIISSFNHPLLKLCENFFPDISKATLIACVPHRINDISNTLAIDSINPSIDCLNKKLVKQIHSMNLQVWVYTVDQPYDIKRCLDYGVDAIFTNFPDKTRAIINEI